MKLPREIEIKLKAEGPRSMKRRLKECGFAVAARRHFERNILFDFRDSRLRRSCSLLRLRMEEGRNILTFKGHPHASDSYKIRSEIETAVEDEGALRRILEALGLHPVFRYEKYRTEYSEKQPSKAGNRCLLVYDETPIGYYLELEGPAKCIDRAARRLGYEKQDYITASYAALYINYCREKGVKAGDMVFSRNKS